MKLWRKREDPDEVFERMLADYIAGFTQGAGRDMTEDERAKTRACFEAGCSEWHRPTGQPI